MKFIHFLFSVFSARAEFFPTIIFINCNHKLSFNAEKREFFLMTSLADEKSVAHTANLASIRLMLYVLLIETSIMEVK